MAVNWGGLADLTDQGSRKASATYKIQVLAGQSWTRVKTHNSKVIILPSLTSTFIFKFNC